MPARTMLMALTIRTAAAAGMTAVIALVCSLVAGPAEASTRITAPHAMDLGPVVEGRSLAALQEMLPPDSSVSEIPGGIDPDLSHALTAHVPDQPAADNGVTRDATGRQKARVTSDWKEVSATGVAVASAQPVTSSKKEAIAVTKASVEFLDAAEVRELGLRGAVVKIVGADSGSVSGPLALRIPDAVLNAGFGGDFASRAQWTEIRTTPGRAGKRSASPAASQRTGDAVILTPTVASSSEPTYLAAASGPTSSSGTGSYAATPFNSASSWDVSAQTGDFSWTYAMRVPPAPAGLEPDLALNYDAQLVDGATGASNNQPSAVGEGWSLSGAGFIERQYVSCARDDGASGPVSTSGDLCWKTDNATVSLAGHSSALVRDSSTGKWRLQADDGSRIDYLVGTGQGCAPNGTWDNDCWRITTTDGTQYYFGLNQLPGWTNGAATTNSTWTVPVFGNDTGEPCKASTFAASSCMQAWRWNLDYIVDIHQNAQALYYNAETNQYSRNGTTPATYTRGGQLARIDYGFVAGNAYGANAPSGRAVLSYDSVGRCSDTSRANCSTIAPSGTPGMPANPAYYPDVPFDQLCSGGTCSGQLSPSFWTTGMLANITTQVLTGSTYTNVDKWELGHSFPSPGDGTNPALWLTGVTHTGYSAGTSITEPATTFAGVTMQNRVWPIDGLAPLDKYRISSIRDSLGAVTSVNYSAPECTPANADTIKANANTNRQRCFPQWWSPQVTPAQAPKLDLFHKYVVTSVVTDPITGGPNDRATISSYVYTGSPAWRYNDSVFTPTAYRTWSDYAGYDKVEVRTGNPNTPTKQQTTQYSFYQGMDGDRASASGGTKTVYVSGSTTERDSRWFMGQTRETVTRNGAGGAIVGTELSTPWASVPTATNGSISARYVDEASTKTTEPMSTGGSRTVTNTTTYDSNGLPVAEESISSDAGATCTKTSYTQANTTAWLVGLPSETVTYALPCADASASAAASTAISMSRTIYDNTSQGATPTKGDATQTSIVDRYTGATVATANWVVDSKTKYDVRGRQIEATDALNRTTTTGFAPATGPTTSITTTGPAPFNWTTTNVLDPAWGLVSQTTDQNGKPTTTTYDALGRLTAVWLTDRPRSSYPDSPSKSYTYTLSSTSPNTIETSTLTPISIVHTFELFDGLGRTVQKQAPSQTNGGTVISDTAYNATGATYQMNAPYWTTSVEPSTALFVPDSPSQIPSTTVTDYDGAGRPTTQTLMSTGSERFRTTTAYLGADRTDVTPPAGGTPTTTIVDSRGQTTALTQYQAAAPSATAPKATTTYAYNQAGNMTSMVGPDNTTWTWEFDTLGRNTRAVDPDSGTTVKTFNLAGDVLSSTDARGITTANSYDGLGRQVGLYKDSATGPILASWKWDTLAKGQLTSSTSYTGSTAGTPGLAYITSVTAYDDGYRPKGSTVSIPTGAPAFGGSTFTRTMNYLPGGSLGSVAYPAEGGLPAETVRYSYTAFGAPGGVTGTSTYGAASYTPTGQLGQLNRNGSNSLFSSYGYDIATGAVKSINELVEVGGIYSEPSESNYTYNDAGSVTSIKTTSDTAAADNQCFNYDTLQNLKTAWTPSSGDCGTAPTSATLGGPAPYWIDYTVGANTGNRQSVTTNPTPGNSTKTVENYSYPSSASPQRHGVTTITRTAGGSSTTATYGYDAAGNVTTRPGQTLTYDALGKLSTLVTGSSTQTNVYDADGQLLLRNDTIGGSTVYLGDTELSRAPNITASSAARTYTLAGTTVAERTTKANVSGSSLYFTSTDAQNTGQLQLEVATGALVQRRQDPFGQSRGSSGVWATRHGFLNAPASTATGLVQLGARVYDPKLGRFLSVDAVLSPFNPQQNNGYSYSENNPITRSDASGNCSSSRTRWGGCTRSNATTKSTTSKPTAAGNAKKPCFRNSCVVANKAKNAKPTFNNKARANAAWAKARPNPEGWRAAAAVGIGIAATIGTIACIASVACGVVALVAIGAAAGAATYTALTAGTSQFSPQGLFVSTVAGGLLSAIPGIGAALSKVVPSVRLSATGQALSTGTTAGARAATGAESPIAARNLARQLASEEQMGQVGIPMAGAGQDRGIDVVGRLTSQYGGTADDWVKMTSTSYKEPSGFNFQTHWYQTTRGARFEFKTNLGQQ